MSEPVFNPVADMAQTENKGGQSDALAWGDPVPTVSILMPAFNAAHSLKQAVASVSAQDHDRWELIIVDDGSTDASAEIAADCAATDTRICLIRHPRNQGAALARNTGLVAARGRYIAFLDADDLWTPDKLSRQIAFMQKTGAALSYTGFRRVRAGTGDHAGHVVRVPAQVDRAGLLRGNVIGCLTAIYDRDQLGDCPMPALPMRHDFALWLDILSRTDLAHGLDAPLAVHRTQPGSLSARRGRATRATWAMYRHHLGLPAYQAAWYLGHHLVRRLLRG